MSKEPAKHNRPFYARFLQPSDMTGGIRPTDPAKDYLRPNDPTA